jgi:CDP-diacylglycerol--glycerol-3-phosphate 3-phosphatidyltransferase
MLAPFANELDKIAPSFDINGSQIRVIQTPVDFYETLKVRHARQPFTVIADMW